MDCRIQQKHANKAKQTTKRTVSEAIRHYRISRLPDGVLSHILCFLPTRDAVQTTILCIRWKSQLFSIPNLDLDYNVLSRHVFEKFNDGVLSLHVSSNIQKFHLCIGGNYYINFGDEHLSRTSGWICKAMKHNIVELDLGIYSNTRFKDLELPDSTDSFFTCKILVPLKVSSNCINLAPPPSASTCFPSLKSLHYSLCRPDSASVFDLLVSKCPVLEDLTIDAHIFAEDVYTLDIPAAGLKTFRFLGTSFVVGKKYSFSFNSPKLENLVVSDRAGLANYYFSNNAKAMVKAVIHFIHGYEDDNINHVVRAPPLLEKVSGVKYLSLYSPRFSPRSLPCFNNLKRLEVGVFLCSYWGYVMELLKRSPSLESIVLDICTRTWAKQNYVEGHQPINPPKDVPVCVSSYLKTIFIINFMGYDNEFDVVKYLMNNSKVLRRLFI
ncbi:hypothetical protein ACLB2K_050615 [Fragaria x ananassa]